MIKNKNNYIDFLEKTENDLAGTSFTQELIDNFNFSKYKKMLKEQELFVPVVGAFSAGKSTLLNTFLGKDYLSIDPSPKTALASELRFSKEEKIEAVKADDSHDTFKIDDIEIIEEKAEDYKYLRYFIDNENVKALEPLILVDMPGFDSPLDLHNQAILEFISKGVHYIVLNSCEAGNIPKSILKQLQFILDLDRDFSFFLSKTDLKPEKDIKEISDYIKSQINDYLLSDKEVYTLSQDNKDNFQKILNTINPEDIFKNLFLKILQSKATLLEDSISTIINTLNSDGQKGLSTIVQLQEGLKQIENKKANLIKEAEASANKSTIDTVKEIKNELLDDLDILAEKASKEPSRFANHLQNTVQSMLREKVMIKIKENKADLLDDFAKELKTMSFDLSIISEDWTDNLKNASKEAMNLGVPLLIAKIGLSFNALIHAVASVLTNLLTSLLASNKKERQIETIKSQLANTMIPDIVSRLNEITPKIFNDNLENITNEISKCLEDEFIKKEDEIKQAQKESEKNKEETQKNISTLSEIKIKLQKNKKSLGL